MALQPFVLILIWISSTQAIRDEIENNVSISEANLKSNEVGFCYKKCVCPNEETATCKEINEEDFSRNIFGNKVKKIDLQNNKLNVLPKEMFENLHSLQHLILANNHLRNIPKDVMAHLPHLESVDLSRNFLSCLEANSFDANKNLKIINLSFNKISIIEDNAFEHLPFVSELDLQSNSLSEFPNQIIALKSLKELNLGKNSIETLDEDSLQRLNILEDLDLRGNPLKSFHINAFAGLSNLKKLILTEVKMNQHFPNFNGTSSLTVLRMDKSKLSSVSPDLCLFCPQLKSLELKGNKLTRVPDLKECKELRVLDLGRNEITDLKSRDLEAGPFESLSLLHDLILHHNNISRIEKDSFSGLQSLQVLDLMANRIDQIHDDAFINMDSLVDINLGMNLFSKFPSRGLKNLHQIKTHNNPFLIEFPGPAHFPKVQTLVLSYAYHCCQFMQSTFENLMPEFTESGNLKETIFFSSSDGLLVDQDNWEANVSKPLWTVLDSKNDSIGAGNFWDMSSRGAADNSAMFVLPPPGIQCMPAPGTFLPCNDLFDWWTLRCSVWIVFLLALLGNGCVVIVLIASRGKMDVPRFLVCNLAAADFFMGLYLGFLAIVDASTLGEFRRYAINWQFSTACQAAGFFGVLSSALSIFTLSVITLERNYAITHAMHLNKRLSLRHAAYIMVCGWIYGIAMASLPLVGVSDYSKFAVCLPFETGDSLSLGYVIFLTLINGVGFSILMGCYLKMYCAIRGSQAWNSNDSRIAKRMALLVFTDFICWFPIALFALTSCFGVHLISLEQAKVFTVFILPLNSCFNPFLYAILTKQFKKDCVMICKAIEESRVTRGIGRCRHSSNFSNRQTPANTNSLNSGSGTHGSHANAPLNKSNMCSCNIKKHRNQGLLISSKWPFDRLKKIILGYKDSNEISDGLAVSGSEYAQQIADIQLKQNKAKRHASLSSENFSSSRSDSWRNHGGHHPHCHQQSRQKNPDSLIIGQPNHQRRNSWTVTRKHSQDSQLSSSRLDSHSSTNSTQTWRMSRSSVSSEMNNSFAKDALGNGNNIPINAPIDPVTGKLNISRIYNQRIRNVGSKSCTPPALCKMASEGSVKPKLIRQTAILADGDSSGSVKSVTFRDPQVQTCVIIGNARRIITASAEVGSCPLHSHEKYKAIYDKLAESSHEESDMEPSDVESDDKKKVTQKNSSGPIINFVPRKLSTISSKDKDSKEDSPTSDFGDKVKNECVFNAIADVESIMTNDDKFPSSSESQLKRQKLPKRSRSDGILAFHSNRNESSLIENEDGEQSMSLLEENKNAVKGSRKKYLNTDV